MGEIWPKRCEGRDHLQTTALAGLGRSDRRRCVFQAKGQPDVGTRLFLKKVSEELDIPVLALMDSDPYGLKILSVYTSGSHNMAYDSLNLTTPNIHWLGVRPSDMDKYGIPDQCRLAMTESDCKVGRTMMKEDCKHQTIFESAVLS